MRNRNHIQQKSETLYQIKKSKQQAELDGLFAHSGPGFTPTSYHFRLDTISQKLVGLLLFTTAIASAIPPVKPAPLRGHFNHHETMPTNTLPSSYSYTNTSEAIRMTTSAIASNKTHLSSNQTHKVAPHYSLFKPNKLPNTLQISLTKAQDKYSSVLQMIQDQKIIRIVAIKVGGFGHLAATETVMAKLRLQMGFQGTFEVIYPNDEMNSVATIFNLPNNLPDVYDDTENKIRFIKLNEQIKRIKNNEVELVMLGMSGAADDEDSTCVWTTLPLNDNDIMMCRNVAKLLNVSIYASVTHDPHNKDYQGSYFQRGDEFFLLDDNDKRYLIDEIGTFFTAPNVTLDQAKSYLQENPSIELKKPALNTFLEGMENQYFSVMPVYGRTLKDSLDGDNYLANMLQIILGARYAQLIENTKKPLIIPFFSDYEIESDLLIKLINSTNWGAHENIWSAEARAAITAVKLDQPEVFSIASIADVKAINQIKALQSNQILLVSMGSFPKIVFSGLFTHTAENIWPQIREGYGTLSSLILTGKPHFCCGDVMIDSNWDVGFDLVEDPSLAIQLKNFYDFKDGFCGQNAWRKDDDTYKKLGELILAATSPDSAFSRYFQTLKTEASKPEKDRVFDILGKVVKIINGEKSALGNCTIDLPDWTPINRFRAVR